jgi:hypothetical protein
MHQISANTVFYPQKTLPKFEPQPPEMHRPKKASLHPHAKESLAPQNDSAVHRLLFLPLR